MTPTTKDLSSQAQGETKYTPGPWEVSLGSKYRVMSATRVIGGVTCWGQYICDTANNTKTRTLENAANARLIAAAPELLEALKFVKAFFQKLEDDMDDDDPLKAIRRHYHTPIHAKIDPAIAKAEGGQ